MIAENVGRQKTLKPGLKTILGGDLNQKKFEALDDFPTGCTIKKLKTGPTRGRKRLDFIYTDILPKNTELLAPLESEEGTRSDHQIILCEAKLKSGDQTIKKTTSFTVQPITKKVMDKFNQKLIATDWSLIEGSTCSESAEKLAVLLDSYVNACFPLKKCKSRSKDPPWITPEVRRKQRRKRRTYKREGKSNSQ